MLRCKIFAAVEREAGEVATRLEKQVNRWIEDDTITMIHLDARGLPPQLAMSSTPADTEAILVMFYNDEKPYPTKGNV